jgi:8-oxo-dGTP diphosphatase
LSATPSTGAALVEVAAAVILREDGSFLLGRRPPGKVYAGYWEFPGGKVEPGEPVRAALDRELREELGIEVQRAYPWIVQRFVYPHAHVSLNFFRVVQWRGEPHPHEGQALAWARAEALDVSPMLPANAPVLRALTLPHALGITCAAQIGMQAFLPRLDAALARGLRMVLVREPQMTAAQRAHCTSTIVQRAAARGARVLVHADPQLARESRAHGVHLPARDLLRIDSRPDFDVCGASCHDERELERAQELRLDYVAVGPVRETPTHPGQRGIGWEVLQQLIRGCTVPVFAIGGMQHADLDLAWQSGAHGVAMIRGAWPSD